MDSVNPLNLSDLIDELRSLDLGHLIDSPKFVICGSPSCGKSSVLDALINVPFPTSETPCTAFPTEIIFRRSPIASCHVSLEPAASLSKSIRQELEGFAGDNFHWRKLPELISRAKKWMGITGSLPASAANVLKVVISKPDHSNMTFVDLPGLYDPADADDPRRLMVSALVQRYLKDPINVILPVIGAETNDSPDGLLRFVEHFDPRHERTLAIVTQLDRLAQISDKTEMFLRLLNDQPLPLGFHALVNRSSETNDISRAERNKREKDFFGRGKWATASRKFVGSGSLLLRLESLVEDHIKRHLSVTMGCITKGVLDCQRRLGDLGHPRATLKEQRGYLFNVSGNFERITSQALNGMYVNDFFVGKDTLENPRKIRAIINSLNETFLEIMRSKGCRRRIVDQRLLPQSTPVETPSYYQEAPEPETVYRADLELEIEDKLRQGRSIESPGYANPLAVGDLFRHQSSMWEALAEDHLLMVSECVRHFVELLLNHLTSEHTCKKLMTMVFDSALEKMKNDMFQKLQELNSYHQRRRPIPLDERLLASRQRIQFDHADRSKPGNTKGGASEIIDLVQTYYNMALPTFVDYVMILAIENCFLGPLENIFSISMINDMDDQMIERLASEPSVIQAEREMLQKELQRLQSALRACSRHNIRASRVSRYRSMSAASPARGSKTASVKSSPESQRVNMFSVDLGNPPIGRSKLENASTGLLSTIVNPPGTGLFQPTLNSARQPAPNSPVRESRVADFSPTIPTINVHPPSDSKLPQNPDPGGLPTSSGRVDTPFKAPSAAEVVFGSTKFSAFRFDNSTVPSTLGVGTGPYRVHKDGELPAQQFWTISSLPRFSNYSLQELRLADYKVDLKAT